MRDLRIRRAINRLYAHAGWMSTLSMFLLSIGVLVIGIIRIVRYPEFSALDESTHVDYAWKISHGELPYAGAPLSPETLDLWSCRGQNNFAPSDLPACGSHAEPESYPAYGENYNYWHPPLYYFIAGFGARFIASFSELGFMDAARVVSLLLALAGVLWLFRIARKLHVPYGLSIATAILPFLFPSNLTTSTIVSPDATTILCGAAAVELVRRTLIDKKSSPWIGLLLGFLVSATKLLNAAAILIAAGVIVLHTFWSNRHHLRDYRRLAPALTGLATIVGVLTVYVSWRLFQAPRALEGWTNPNAGINSNYIEGTVVDEWTVTLLSGFNLAGGGNIMGHTIWLLSPWISVLTLLSVTVGVAGYFLVRKSEKAESSGEELIPVTLSLGLLVWPTIVQLEVALKESLFFPTVTPRYGNSFIPLMTITLALVAQRQKISRPVITLIIAGYVLVALSLLGVAIDGL